MKRLALLALTLLIPALSFAQARFIPGQDYRVLEQPVATSTTDKVEVVELFWYGCPHCYALEPNIEQWLESKPDNVEFVRIPAIFGQNWALDARVFLTAQTMGILETTHRPYFDEIHKNRNRMRTPEQVADFMATLGIDRDEFLKAFNSFAVETKVKQTQDLVRRYGAQGVPVLLVNGKFEVSGTLAGSTDRMIEILEALIAQEQGA